MSKTINDLLVGDKVKFGSYAVGTTAPSVLKWYVAERNRTGNGYPASCTTLITEKAIDQKSTGASTSAWFNNSPLGLWFADETNGFLKDFTAEEKAAITVGNYVCYNYNSTVNHVSKATLTSSKENGYNLGNSDGQSTLNLFNTAAKVTQYASVVPITNQWFENQPLVPTVAVASAASSIRYFVRDSYTTTAYTGGYTPTVMYQNGSGISTYSAANTTVYAIRPIINIPNTTAVSDVVDEDGYYLVLPTGALETISTTETDTLATKMTGLIDYTKEATDTITVMACNNAYDDTPAWEDVTTNVLNKTEYTFINTTKIADKAGVSIKVTITKA